MVPIVEGRASRSIGPHVRRWRPQAIRLGAGAYPVAVRLLISSASGPNCFSATASFEAYVPKEKRLFGYFRLPVLLMTKSRRSVS